MNGSVTLLEKLWIVKDREKEAYFDLRRQLKEIEKFSREYTGWRLISNEKLIKYEKLPAKAMPFMGINDFQDKLDYVFLLVLLIFLEDREDGESFLLTELVDMIEVRLKGKAEPDWTAFLHRKSLVRMMQYAEKIGLINRQDGDIDQDNVRSEVLYENTGLSRYFAVSHAKDVTEFQSFRDFEKTDEMLEADRGYLRINRVYRTLSVCPAMYWDNQEDADSLYLKNQRQWVSRYLGDYLGARLDIHRNAAFLIMDGEVFGSRFPTSQTLSDIVLHICTKLREKNYVHESDDTVLLPDEEFTLLLHEVSEETINAWSKEYRELPFERLKSRVLFFMQDWMMAQKEEKGVRMYPAAFLFEGVYPKDYNPESVKPQEPEEPEPESEPQIPETKQLSLFDMI